MFINSARRWFRLKCSFSGVSIPNEHSSAKAPVRGFEAESGPHVPDAVSQGWGAGRGWAPNLEVRMEFISAGAELPIGQAAEGALSPGTKHLSASHASPLQSRASALRAGCPLGVCSRPKHLSHGGSLDRPPPPPSRACPEHSWFVPTGAQAARPEQGFTGEFARGSGRKPAGSVGLGGLAAAPSTFATWHERYLVTGAGTGPLCSDTEPQCRHFPRPCRQVPPAGPLADAGTFHAHTQGRESEQDEGPAPPPASILLPHCPTLPPHPYGVGA